MQTLWQDMRFGLRLLKNSPGFTLVAIFTLALGIGVNATVFGWVDSILLHPFPGIGDAGGLAIIETVTSTGEPLVNMSFTDYRDYRDNLNLASGIAVARTTPLNIGTGSEAERAWGELVSGNYFDLLRVKPALGRTFLPAEAGDQPGAYPVVVISDKLWRRRFHSDPNVLGKTIRMNRHELTIVGVAPREFQGSTAGLTYDVWMPVTMAAAMGTGNGTLTYRGTRDLTTTFMRLKPGVSIAQARAEVAALARRLASLYPRTNAGVDAVVVPISAAHNGAQRLLAGPLRILMAVGVLMLLIVCVNVANLLLARLVSRQQEFGIRIALGSGRWRLARQLLTETVVLACAGGALGILMAMWMGHSLGFLLPPNDFPVSLETGLSIRSLSFTLLLCFAASVLAGTAPALLSARADVGSALKEGGRSGSGTHSHRLRGLLVACEVALASIALIGAGLFFRSFKNASTINPGFDPAHISVSQFYLSSAGYSASEQRMFCRTLRERLETVPGVVAVSYSDVIPLGFGSSPWHQLDVEGYVPAKGEDMYVHRSFVPPGYFELMRIPMVEGRDFVESDEPGKPVVIVVNQTFARRYFGGASPLGRRVRVENAQAIVVGMVRDSKYHHPAETPTPFFYMPFRQFFAPGLNFAFFVKTAGDPLRLTETIRREALALNQDAVFSTTLLSEAIRAGLYPQKVAASLLTVLGLASLLLAAIGLYSVMSYSVTQRTRELGLRMALGARSADVLQMIVREGLTLTLTGLAAGIAGALAVSRLIAGMLVNVGASDPLTFLFAALFLSGVALLACVIPALRATRVDPMSALRWQ